MGEPWRGQESSWKGPGLQDTIARELEQIRDRLLEIEDERSHLDESDEKRHHELLREEQRLENRLTEIEEEVTEDRGGAREKAASQTDLTRSPKLPDSKDEF